MCFGFTASISLIGGNIFTVATRATLKGNMALPSFVFSATNGSPVGPDGLSTSYRPRDASGSMQSPCLPPDPRYCRAMSLLSLRLDALANKTFPSVFYQAELERAPARTFLAVGGHIRTTDSWKQVKARQFHVRIHAVHFLSTRFKIFSITVRMHTALSGSSSIRSKGVAGQISLL